MQSLDISRDAPPQVKQISAIQRVLFTVSDKTGICDLAWAFHQSGAEIIATGRTAKVLEDAGLPVLQIEEITGKPEAFQGRMKTLSFEVCSGILHRRGDPADLSDLEKLKIKSIDAVVVNFYPFERAVSQMGISKSLVEEIDIGGPTLVRAAAKNAPHTLALTNPSQYQQIILELNAGGVTESTSQLCASQAWDLIVQYDQAIARVFGKSQKLIELKYGENPHQKGWLQVDEDSPILWPVSALEQLTPNEISYNNAMDLSAGVELVRDLHELFPTQNSVVIIKHSNPSGVAVAVDQLVALQKAWEGDPVSAFGGVVILSRALEGPTAAWLKERFIELISAPDLTCHSEPFQELAAKRKNLKAVSIRTLARKGLTTCGLEERAKPRQRLMSILGGTLFQTEDATIGEEIRSVTLRAFESSDHDLAWFGIVVTRALKSNAIALVRKILMGKEGETDLVFQLVGAGQGQPNRVDALRDLAFPRALKNLSTECVGLANDRTGLTAKFFENILMVSDAFFPFKDTVETAFKLGIRKIIQPGGSIKDHESIEACNALGVSMGFTGIRHFRH